MEDIKIGEYIRFNDGIIAKVKKIKKAHQDNEYYIHYSLDENNIRNYSGITTERSNVKNVIKKHSFNIIDLIEEGDILKIKDIPYAAEYISEVFEDYENNLCVSDFEVAEIRSIRKYVDENKIKIIAILTKEQFEAMEYEVK